MTLTLSVFENKRMLHWDSLASTNKLNEQLNEFYRPDQDELEEHKQFGRVTGYTVWKGNKVSK